MVSFQKRFLPVNVHLIGNQFVKIRAIPVRAFIPPLHASGLSLDIRFTCEQLTRKVPRFFKRDHYQFKENGERRHF